MKSLSCGCMNQTSDIRHPTSNVKVLPDSVARRGIETVRVTRMHRLFVSLLLWVLFAAATRAESPSYLVFVSNERSGDVTVIDGSHR